MGKLLRNPFILMFLAGLTYLGTTAFVLKKNWTKLSEPEEAAPATRAKHELVLVGARPFDVWSTETDEMIAELRREKSQLEERGKDLDTLKGRLDGEKAELDRLKTEIVTARQELDKAATEMSEDETRNLRPLSQTYSKLSPKATVAIFRELDDATALKILSLMKNDAVSAIFEEMAHTSDQNGSMAVRAAALTEKLRLLKKSSASASVASAPAP